MQPRMPLWRLFYSTILDALFPIPPAEREVMAMNGIEAFKTLPRAPQCSIPDACSVFAYKDERVSRLVWSIKYKKSYVGAAIAGHALYHMARLFSLSVPPHMRVMVVPMPITKLRRRERGFNQCELILDEMEKLDIERRLLFASNLLMRVHHTSRQTMKDRAERLESMKGLFAVDETVMQRFHSHAKDLFVVVIDDVVTTGSTIRDAIETLRRAGFENTYGLSVAH